MGIVHEVDEVVIAGDGCEPLAWALAYLFSEAERALRDEKANTDRNSRQPLRAPSNGAGLERERDHRAPSGTLR